MGEFEKKEDKADDLEEDLSPYIDDETTTEREIEDFEKSLKADAKKTISNFNDGSIEVDEETYLEMIRQLNDGQRKIFDDFVERINRDGDPFYLYIGGQNSNTS